MRSPLLTELPAPPSNKKGWPWTINAPVLTPNQPDGLPWPSITVVTPSYNQRAFVEETIRSVLLQGYPNLEYILMDGGSTDGTMAILERYRPFFRCLRIAPDGGQAAAIANGFEHT